jgi:hypothetical protein
VTKDHFLIFGAILVVSIVLSLMMGAEGKAPYRLVLRADFSLSKVFNAQIFFLILVLTRFVIMLALNIWVTATVLRYRKPAIKAE